MVDLVNHNLVSPSSADGCLLKVIRTSVKLLQVKFATRFDSHPMRLEEEG